MKEKPLLRNIAAVSLIEIMMIFTIIGVVTAASMGLSKPKANYMRNIRLYSALVTLERAGRAIAQDGHLDFSTDIGLCTSRNASTFACIDNEQYFRNLNNQLPKVSHRAASTNAVQDVGLPGFYTNLGNANKLQYKMMQDGLCQRIVSALKLYDVNNNCSNSTADSNLINDSTAYPTNFYGTIPQIYLNNGQVLYIGRNLYTDFRTNGSTTRKIIATDASSNATARQTEDNIMNADISTFVSTFNNYPNSTVLTLPNETRAALIERFINTYNGFDTFTNKAFVNYLNQVYKSNKDYFIIYVDTDCKKTSQNDKKCGTDTLNDDVFAFRMYRDGTVLPDYQSNFDRSLLTAKIFFRNTQSGGYSPIGNRATNVIPFVAAKCYANLAGSYASGYEMDSDHEYMGICSTGFGTEETVPKTPRAECYSNIGETQCKVILNKPSFLMR